MTTPATARAPSGQRRYYTAQQAAAAILALTAAASAAFLALIAWYVFLVLTGALIYAVAVRQLRSAMLTQVDALERQLRGILAATVESARADVQAILAEDLGPMTRLLPPLAPVPFTRLGPSVRHAILTAMADAETVFRQAAETGSLDVAQQVLDDLAVRGLTGYIDSLGRRWEVGSYTSMAARTAVEQLHIALQTRAFQAAGIDLIRVWRFSATPPCPKCVPWQRKILSLSGRSDLYPSLADAIAAGLLHPSCRDTILPWNQPGPGVPSSAWITRQNRRYQAEQAANVRWANWRRAQRLATVALTPQARRRARALARRLGLF